jgi:hypothetical protein
MAKISNTTSYPNATAASTDYVIGTDVSDNNNTKTFTLQDIANLNAFSPGSGTVTSVGMSGASTGLTFTSDTVSPIVNTGTFTLGGSLGFANGGTGLTALGNAGEVLKVNSAATGFEFGLDASGPGSGTIGRMAYWTTGANPGVLGSAPIKYTPASSDPAVNELTEIISNSTTHQIKIGTEATAGLVQLGGTNAGTIVRSSGTVQIDSGDSDAVTIQGGILTNISTTSRSGHVNLINYNTNPSSGVITSSINIGDVNGSSGWLADSINMFKDVNIANVVNLNSSIGAYFSNNKKIQLSRSTNDNTGTSRLAAPVYINQSSTSASPTTNIWTQVSTSGAQKCISFGFNNGEAGFIRPTSSSAIEINGYTSDERLKTDIVDWDDKVLDKFKAINPKKYKYTKDKELEIEKEFKGFIAQDMQDKFPEAYKKDLPAEDNVGYYYFDPIAMITPLMKAIKELNEKIESLEAKVKVLEG